MSANDTVKPADRTKKTASVKTAAKKSGKTASVSGKSTKKPVRKDKVSSKSAHSTTSIKKKPAKKSLKKKARQRRTRLRLVALAAALILAAALWLILTRRPSGDPQGPAIPYETTAVSDTPTATAAPDGAQIPAMASTPEPTPQPTVPLTPVPTATPAPTPVTITMNFCGDCTIGGDFKGSSEDLFYRTVLDDEGYIDYEYCFRNVKPIFEADDVTVANLEVVLTTSTDYLKRDDKQFIMRGRPEYVNMLLDGSIEVCNIANNHMTDFGDWGVEYMADMLEQNGLGRCGYGYTHIRDVKGVKIGFVGINYWTTKESSFREQLEDMRGQCDIMIVSMHWGNELEYYPLKYQQEWGKIAVDLGADLVIGHHPHVVEGIESYKDVNIVYSLGNFCFGGNKNPRDKDTFIYQHEFTVYPDGTYESTGFKVIPCKITSVPDDDYNNYQPTPIEDPADQVRVLKKIEEYSSKLKNPVKLTE